MDTVFKPTLLQTILLVLTAVWCPVSAEDVTVLINSTVSQVYDPSNILGGVVSIGDIALGGYTFSATPSDVQDGEVEYRHTDPPFGINVNVGGMTFQTDDQSTDFRIRIQNNDGGVDTYIVTSYKNTIGGTDKAIAVNGITWYLEDESMTALDSTALLGMAPDVTQWQSWNDLVISGCWLSNYDGAGGCYRPFFQIRAHVTEATEDLSAQPTVSPSSTKPSYQPSGQPSLVPTAQPSFSPIAKPSYQPSGQPSGAPTTAQPSFSPSAIPTKIPSLGEQLEDVQASLNQMLSTNVIRAQDSSLIAAAIEELSNVLSFPEDPADVTKDQFDSGVDAIKALMQVDTVNVTELISTILEGYRTLVSNAFEQVDCSTTGSCDEKTVDKVNKKLSSAQKQLEKGHFANTLQEYSKAMQEVQKLLGSTKT